MVIKNKDGSDFQLRGPNPIMKNQNLWDGFEIHNMNFNEIIDHIKNQQKKTTLVDLNKKEIIIEDKGKKLEKIQEKEVEPEPEPEPEKEVKPEKEAEKKESPEVKKTIIHCLPANVSVKQDNLYGDVKKIIKYGEKFTFESVILDMSDFEFVFWTNIEIPKESIIYPKNSDKRWWKISNFENKFNGFVFYAKISNITPNFED